MSPHNPSRGTRRINQGSFATVDTGESRTDVDHDETLSTLLSPLAYVPSAHSGGDLSIFNDRTSSRVDLKPPAMARRLMSRVRFWGNHASRHNSCSMRS